MDIPATGRQATFTLIAIYRMLGGKIQEEWNCADTLGLMRQLGVVPSAFHCVLSFRSRSHENATGERQQLANDNEDETGAVRTIQSHILRLHRYYFPPLHFGKEAW